MKKILTSLILIAMAITGLFAAEPKELVYGKDYEIVSTGYGDKYFKIDGKSVYYAPGSRNNNHAVLFKLTDPSILYKGSVIEVTYKLDKYNDKASAQLVIQPSSEKAADYGKQSYPVIYNNLEPETNKNVFTVDVDKLLNSSVRKELVGFRMINNEGGYQNFKWQSDWKFTITKVVLKDAK